MKRESDKVTHTKGNLLTQIQQSLTIESDLIVVYPIKSPIEDWMMFGNQR